MKKNLMILCVTLFSLSLFSCQDECFRCTYNGGISVWCDENFDEAKEIAESDGVITDGIDNLSDLLEAWGLSCSLD